MARRPGRVTGKAARRNRWWTKRRNQWIGGGVALAVLGVGGIAYALNDSSSSTTEVAETPGERWKREIAADFTTMSQGAVSYLQTINDWRTGKAQASAVDAAAGVALNQFLNTRAVLAGRAGFPEAPRALLNYRDSVELYIVHARLAKLGAKVSDDQLNRQIQRIMGRLRYLADRLFDLGGDEMAPFATPDSEVEGFEYQRTVDVPSFAGTDLAPGPPLTPAKPAAAQAREYQKVRPERPFLAWLAAVEAAKIPTVQAEVEAIRDGTVQELDAMSEQLTAASDHLYAAPDPMEERELSTRVQLGLLTQAEAMRAAQLSRLVEDDLRPEAVEITQVLALLGNAMWDDARLGPRDTGYPKTLLTDRPRVAPPPPDPATPPPTDAPAPDAAADPSPTS